MKKHSRKSSPTAYSDVKHILDLALEKPGLIYRLPTYGKAINFRQRCHRYTNLLREMQDEVADFVPGHRSETLYDKILIRQINEEGSVDKYGRSLRFDFVEPEGELIDPDTGLPIQIVGPHISTNRE